MNDTELVELLQGVRVIAVVGLSANPERPSNQVAWYLHHQGYRLYGVNPHVPGPLFGAPGAPGVPVVAALADVPEPVDLVDVFRRPEYVPEVARAAVAVGARALWLQLGIRDAEAEAIATRAGLAYVQDHCLKVEHARLLARAR
jgi:predicted CoA-binding protein